MSRVSKVKKENRDVVIPFRLTQREHERLQERLKTVNSSLNQSEYIRECIFSGDIERSILMQRELKKISYELRKIGVNLNQIAARINGQVYLPYDMNLLTCLLEGIEDEREKLEQALEAVCK